VLDLVGMADEPPLETAQRDLGVTLQGQTPRAPGERLVVVGRCRGQVSRACRQIEGVPVPVHDSRLAIREWRQTGSPPGLAELQRGPADLRTEPRIHLRPEGSGYELRAQTDPERREIRRETAFQQAQFVGQERIGGFLRRSDWASQDDEDLGSQRIQLAQVVDSGFDVPRPQAALLQRRRQIAKVLTGDMPYHHREPHGVLLSNVSEP
jgi:hypothetical protein